MLSVVLDYNTICAVKAFRKSGGEEQVSTAPFTRVLRAASVEILRAASLDMTIVARARKYDPRCPNRRY
jgi:hypothetical protein